MFTHMTVRQNHRSGGDPIGVDPRTHCISHVFLSCCCPLCSYCSATPFNQHINASTIHQRAGMVVHQKEQSSNKWPVQDRPSCAVCKCSHAEQGTSDRGKKILENLEPRVLAQSPERACSQSCYLGVSATSTLCLWCLVVTCHVDNHGC